MRRSFRNDLLSLAATLTVAGLMLTGCDAPQPPPTATSTPTQALAEPAGPVPVFVQSHAGSAVAFELPPDWSVASVTRQSVTYQPPKGGGEVTVSWRLAESDQTQLADLVADARVSTARQLGTPFKYACLTVDPDADTAAGRITQTFQNPCGTDGAPSAWISHTVDLQPAPAEGRTLTTATWLGTVSQEEWTITYTAPEGETLPAVEEAVAEAHLQQLASESLYGETAVGAAPDVTAVELPAAWVPASQLSAPDDAPPGGDVSDACRLFAAADVAKVGDMPPPGGIGHLKPSTGEVSRCDQSFADPGAGGSSESYIGDLMVSIRSESLPDAAVDSPGVAGSSHDLTTFTTLRQWTDQGDFVPIAYVAAGPKKTVMIQYVGQYNGISAWEEHVLAAAVDRVAQRLASGDLEPKLPVTPADQPGVVADGIHYGEVQIDPSASLCDALPKLASVSGLTMTDSTGFPPGCTSDEDVEGFSQLTVNVWDGHSIAGDIATDNLFFPCLSKTDTDVFTQLIDGVTSVVCVTPPSSTTPGVAEAAIAVDLRLWVEVRVPFDGTDASSAVALRDKIIPLVVAAG